MCSVVAFGFSVLVNAQGGVLRSSICWNLKSPTFASVDNDPARAWSWSDLSLFLGFKPYGPRVSREQSPVAQGERHFLVKGLATKRGQECPSTRVQAITDVIAYLGEG